MMRISELRFLYGFSSCLDPYPVFLHRQISCAYGPKLFSEPFVVASKNNNVFTLNSIRIGLVTRALAIKAVNLGSITSV